MIAQYQPTLTGREAQAVMELFKTGAWLSEFVKTAELEDRAREFIGMSFCTATTSGTMGLYLALKACGVEDGDKILVPALTMIATANAVRMAGADPVFCDIDDNLCMDAEDIDLEPFAAVIYVSLNGRCGNIERLKENCAEACVPLIEDACQSFGSYHNGKPLGRFGDACVFSLSPHKIIGSGQGGLVMTNDGYIATRLTSIKDHGRLVAGSDKHDSFGINAKYTDLQAVIALEQLKEIENRIALKRRLYDLYFGYLNKVKGINIKGRKDEETPWFVDIYTDDRDELADYMKKFGVSTRNLYKTLPKQKCYKESCCYHKAEQYSNRGLWLPSSMSLTEKDVYVVSEVIKGYFNQ
jgi:perosamine synthetase